MLKSLIRIRFASVYKSMFQTSGNKKYMKYLFAGLMLYAFGSMFVSFGAIFKQLCLPLYQAGLSWFYFAVAAIFAFNLCLLGSVLAADSQLFEARDNELLLSMPIPPKYVLISRISILLGTDYLFVLLFSVPAGYIYFSLLPVSAGGLALFAAAFLALPFLVLPVSCLLGWLIAWVSTKIRRRSAFIFGVYLLLFAVYFSVYSALNSYISAILSNGKPLADAVRHALPPFYFLGSAIADKSLLSLLFYFLCAAVPCAVVIGVLSKNYFKIMMTSKRVAKKQYVEREMKASGALKALTKKEISFFLSRPMYMMNAGLGLIFMVVFAVAAAVKGESILSSLEGLPENLPFDLGPIAAAVLCACAAMVLISAPSVSLEGKCLWIPKSIPVKAESILRAKIAAHVVISLPFVVLSGAICAVALGGSAATLLLYFLLPLASTVLCAVLGVAVNMKLPKFDWINETIVIKQSAATLVTMTGALTAVIVPLIAIFYAGFRLAVGMDLLLLLLCAFLFLLACAVYALLRKNADKKFAAL